MSQLKKKTLVSDAFKTALEEGWRRVEDCDVSTDFDGADEGVAEAAVFGEGPPWFNLESKDFSSAYDCTALLKEQGIPVFNEDFRIPRTLSEEGNRLARDFRGWLAVREDAIPDGGGCPAFRDPYYQAGFEQVGMPRGAVLALVFDGGVLAHYMNPSYECYGALSAAQQFFDIRGYLVELQTHWWAWVIKEKSE